MPGGTVDRRLASFCTSRLRAVPRQRVIGITSFYLYIVRARARADAMLRQKMNWNDSSSHVSDCMCV